MIPVKQVAQVIAQGMLPLREALAQVREALAQAKRTIAMLQTKLYGVRAEGSQVVILPRFCRLRVKQQRNAEARNRPD